MFRFFIIFALIFICVSPFHRFLLNNLTRAGSDAQNKCISSVENKTAHFSNSQLSTTDEISALLCGKNISTQSRQSLYAVSGLIHLFVVSGSHFILLEKLACFFRVPLLVRLTLHTAFLFFSGFQPPAARFFIQFILFTGFFQNSSGLRSDQKTFLSGILTLCLFPSWITSLSFLLSWAASLIISCCQEITNITHRILLRQIFIFLILFPLLCHIQTPHPLSIPLNLLLGDLLGITLLPLAVLAVFFQSAFLLMEFLLMSLSRFLEIIFHTTWHRLLVVDVPAFLPQPWMATWVLLIHALVHLVLIKWRRQQLMRSFPQPTGLEK